jgi:hypothetical protein
VNLKKLAQLVVAVLVAAVLIVPAAVVSPKVAKAFDPTRAPEIQERLLDGLADFELDPTGEMQGSSGLTSYQPRNDDGCGLRLRSNVKVNQNCLNLTDSDLQGRGQAQNETSIATDPLHPGHMVASYNDYRRGDGGCIGAYSLDGGKSWTDTVPPTSFTRGDLYGSARQYWQAGGDTSVAWDTKGNAYLSCQMFNRGVPASSNPDVSSAFFVFRSTGNNGASWNFPARPVAQSPDLSGSGAQPFLDKQLMTVDNHPGSPFQDRVYVTWTTFDADGTAYIYGAYSSDYAETFSDPVLISQGSALCGNTYGLPTPNGSCNENQFSQPFTGSDGNLYVVWANYNNVVTGADNRNQLLLAKSTDGGVTFSAPVSVGDFYDLPDCATYQGGADFGRACVPEKGATNHSIFRAANYPSAAVNPQNPSQVVVSFGSYISRFSNEQNGCVPSGVNPATGINLFQGVKTPGACSNKILLSVSSNAGLSFTGAATDPRETATVNTAAGQATTDQFWQWLAFTGKGDLAVSYYDRQYGDDEITGASDISLSSSRDLRRFGVTRVTSSSMPPPTQFSGVFYGDYSGLATTADTAFPIWMDTRTLDLFACPGTGSPGAPPAVCTGTEAAGPQAGLTANDQEIFTAAVKVHDREGEVER